MSAVRAARGTRLRTLSLPQGQRQRVQKDLTLHSQLHAENKNKKNAPPPLQPPPPPPGIISHIHIFITNVHALAHQTR